MKKIYVLFSICMMSMFVSTDVFSGEVRTNFDDVDITLGGQLRPRFEVNDKGTTAGSDTDNFISQRSRLNFGVDAGAISGFVQLQDVRNWGEETSTLEDSADGMDVHQAYVGLKDFSGLPLSLKVGRQEIKFDGHRLVGSVNWAQQARSFDAIRVNTNLGPAGVSLVYANEGENGKDDENIFMAYAKTKITDASAISGILVWQNDDATGVDLDRVTLGARGTAKINGIKGRLEGYYQTGNESATVDAQAYMLGVRVGYAFDTPVKPSITLWYDYLSGDDGTDATKDKSFNTLYQTGHKFHGHMDYFVANGNRTLGLHDIAVKGKMSATDDISLHAAVHYFMTAEDAADGGNDLGAEMDLAAKWKYDKHLGISAGYSHFFNEKLSRTGVATHGDEDADWAYVMMDFQF